MTGFAFAAGGLLLLALAITLWPWWRARRGSGVEQNDANVDVYREAHEQIAADHRTGLLDDAGRALALAELEERLIGDLGAPAAEAAPVGGRRPVAWTAVVAVLVPAIAIGVYLHDGNPGLTEAGALQAAAGAPPPDHDIDKLVAGLEEKLRAKPDDANGWKLLGRVRAVQGKYPESAAAYERSIALAPADADTLADYAESVGLSQGRNLQGRPAEIAQRALAIDPDHRKALALAATAAWTSGDAASASRLWARLLAQFPPDSEDAKHIRSILAEIKTAAPSGGVAAGPAAGRVASPGSPPVASPPAASGPVALAPARSPPTGTVPAGSSPVGPSPGQPSAAPAASPGAQATPARADSGTAGAISGTVTLKPEFARSLDANAMLYVFARAAEGPRMPLAVLRVPAKSFPFAFRLDDSLGMAGGPVLSAATAVVVEARISRGGDARPQPGDPFGRAGPVKPGTSGLNIAIDAVVP